MDRLNVEGVWSVIFGSALGSLWAGVVSLEDGKLRGGDSSFTYIGIYRVDNRIFNADFMIRQYTQLGGKQPMFGPLANYQLRISGKADPQFMSLMGFLAGSPEVLISLHATRQADLN